jgi:putative iron-only hydrogenase system regulator
MHKRLGVAGIVIEDTTVVPAVNAILHEFAELIVGRMGIPYRTRGVSIVSIILDGSTDDISALTGRLGRVPGVSVKTALTREAASVATETERQEA